MTCVGQPSPPTWRSFPTLPRAYGKPPIQCRLRSRAEDFLVDEELAFAADGEGEHCLLRVRKTNANTQWVAQRLAAIAGVSSKAVGYAGLKDRHAVTTQWFSLHLGARPEPNWESRLPASIELLESHRHRRKLRRGLLVGNRFAIRLRNVEGDLDALAQRMDQIATQGVPNYFGPQRFGRNQGNLYRADDLFRSARQDRPNQLADQPTNYQPGHQVGHAHRQRPQVSRHLRGLWLSAARSQLFNEVLALRVERGDWQTALPGERLQLQGSQSHFLAEIIDPGIRERIDSGDAQPTGPLFGTGDALTAGEVAKLESGVAARFPAWCDGLIAAGLRQERRPLRLRPMDMALSPLETGQWLLHFQLPAGSYATTILRELTHWVDAPDESRLLT